jgi:hypothetical protein
MEEFLSDWDARLCPAAAVPAFTHRRPGGKIEVDGEHVAYGKAGAHYTTIFTFTGNPVVALPIARSGKGLPVGAQLVGRRWRDNALLDVAAAIAEVTGGFRRPPGHDSGHAAGADSAGRHAEEEADRAGLRGASASAGKLATALRLFSGSHNEFDLWCNGGWPTARLPEER